MATSEEIAKFHNWAEEHSILVPKGKSVEEDGGPSWPLLYMRLADEEIPDALWNCLCTLRAIEPKGPLAQLLLEDLLSRGEDSETHRLFTLLWERLDHGLTDEEIAAFGRFGSAIVAGLNTLMQRKDRGVLNDVSHSDLNTHAMVMSLLEKELIDAFPRHKRIVRFSMKADLNFLGLPMWREIPITLGFNTVDKIAFYSDKSLLPPEQYGVDVIMDLLKSDRRWRSRGYLVDAIQESFAAESVYARMFQENQEFLTSERAAAFLDLAEEYNLEWATASFDWGNGIAPRIPSTVRRFVAESPWDRTKEA